jgi:hypothetical protein
VGSKACFLRVYFSVLVFVLSLFGSLGCARNLDSEGFVVHPLTPAQEERQNELLNEIRWLISAKNELAGKAAADYAELLALADRTKSDGQKTIHAYDAFAGGGGDHEPCTVTIIVSRGKISAATWPYGEY